MGDRANIGIQYDDGSEIFFYSHWSGSGLPEVVQAAISKRERWTDESYLARIIFDVLTCGHQGEETGFGIAPYICDPEYPIIYINPKDQTVRFDEGGYNYQDAIGFKITFEELASMKDAFTWDFVEAANQAQKATEA